MSETIPKSSLHDAYAALREGRHEAAEFLFEALCRDQPLSPAGFTGLAYVAQARSDWGRALERWDGCLDRFADSPPGWRLARGWALFHLRRLAEAEAVFAALCDGASPAADAFLGAALSVAGQQRWADAVLLWDRLFERFPDRREPKWLISRAKCLQAAGRPDSAAAAYGDVLAANPDLPMAHQAHAELLLHLGRPEEAALANARALHRAPEDAGLLLQAADIAIRRDDLDGARAALRSALAAADELWHLDRVFVQAPSVFEGWDRTALWLDLERRLAAVRPAASAAATVLTLRLKLALRDHDGFLAGLDRAPAGTDAGWMKKFHHTARLLRGGPFPDFAAEKIFGIGLNKTGTTSLIQALEILGYHSTHYLNLFTRELLTIDDAFLFDSMGDTPVSVMFEALYHLFPNSRFVYTARPMESWVKSFNDHFRRSRCSSGLDDRRHLLTTRGAGVNGVQRALVHGVLYCHHPDAVAARLAFEARVENFFAAHDRTRLLKFDIFSGDGWEKLGAFVGRPVPAEPFPWENKAPGRD